MMQYRRLITVTACTWVRCSLSLQIVGFHAIDGELELDWKDRGAGQFLIYYFWTACDYMYWVE